MDKAIQSVKIIFLKHWMKISVLLDIFMTKNKSLMYLELLI